MVVCLCWTVARDDNARKEETAMTVYWIDSVAEPVETEEFDTDPILDD